MQVSEKSYNACS